MVHVRVNSPESTAAVGDVYACGVLKSTCMIPFGFPKVVSCLCHRAISGVSIISTGNSDGFSGGGFISKFVAMKRFSAGRCKSSLDSAIFAANSPRA